MKRKPLTIVGCCSLLAALLAGIVTAQAASSRRSKSTAGATSKDIAAIRQSAAAFREAFNRGDAKAVAALWTKDGECIDESGKRFDGRAAMKRNTPRFLPLVRHKIAVVVDADADHAGRFGGDRRRPLLVEDTARPGAAGYSKYTAVHVKADDQNESRMSSVRETAAEPQAGAGQLRNDRLVGRQLDRD